MLLHPLPLSVYSGTVQPDGKGGFVTRGKLQQSRSNRGAEWRITELPVGVWTTSYKDLLDQLVHDGAIKVSLFFCAFS